ncbi:reducing type I polyketide synthase [Lindgomyces ingoldianus]|uniref:Reducing type I polyketide synthase n=1 Tax=Lindgomyces ingoldianus TaxID=673940 RepID=A0ACB6QDI9_9PLEO|nr:reducing type I polyketide synthase [Lindgomyces ingoldianus]KAF2464560.1 reducing type I polyketide synthase [Lindgomyces ingoldianus]
MTINDTRTGNSMNEGLLNSATERQTHNGIGCETRTSVKDVLDPIAIIGFSFRFPQDATSTEAFWRMLVEKRNAMTEWPEERLNLDSFYHPENGRKGNFPVRGAHFLNENPEAFDAPFFSITTKEACSMDPQQRGLLETAYTALENAGITMDAAYGSKTSVFTGCFHDDYKSITGKDPEDFPTYAATGLSQAMLANRISWFFNLTGTSVNLDSACSSSMIALDMAVQGLRSGDSGMALVGGTNSILGPDSFLSLTNMNFLSHDSLSYSFDERGNGYSKGEGHCVIILKRVSDAIRDGNTIRAVIRSTGSNQDGHTPGITQPSATAQETLIRDTYRKAGLDLVSTKYVEAHGTGTAVGDPLEASAISNCFGNPDTNHPVYIGAVKSNIGHLEGASGLAGIIKTVLILERGVIPPNANFENLNPKINFGSSNVKISEQCVPWPTSGLRRASVNCFGFGGANSHAVLEDAYHFLRLRGLRGFHCTTVSPPSLDEVCRAQRQIDTPYLSTWGKEKASAWRTKNAYPQIYVFSTADEGGLTRLSTSYNDYLMHVMATCKKDAIGPFLESLAYTLSERRTKLPWRSFALANSIEELRELKISPAVRSKTMPRMGFIFSGQGAQFAGMGKNLLGYPVFKASVLRSQTFLQDLGCPWTITEEFLRGKATSNINLPEYSQPLCTVLQIALVDLFRDINLVPSTVAGHSSGEIAAAYCIGALSHRSAIKVAFFRGMAAESLRTSGSVRGSMIAVGLSCEAVSKYLPLDNSICVACINSPESVTLSGDDCSMPDLKASLDQDGVFARKLQVDVAYHSHHMEQIADSYGRSLHDLERGEFTDIQMVSSVTGKAISRERLCTREYWVKNMVSPVRFHEAATKIAAGFAALGKPGVKTAVPGVSSLLEIGPHSALKKPVEDILKAIEHPPDIAYYSALTRGQPDFQTLAATIGHLFCRGHSLSIDRFNRPACTESSPTLASAPEYPFNHSQKYWRESRLSKEGYRFRKAPPLDLLGTPVPDWNPQEARWRRFMKVSQLPWIQDHIINGTAIYPATGMIVMAIEGIRQLSGTRRPRAGYSLENVTFHRPITVRQGEDGVETELYLRSLGNPSDKERTWSEFRVFSFDNGDCVEHCRGNIRVDFTDSTDEAHFAKEIMEKTKAHRAQYQNMVDRCTRPVHSQTIYDHLNTCGYEYGSAFQALDDVHGSTDTESVATVKVFDWNAKETANHVQPHVIHPVTLDAAAQLMLVALAKTGLDVIPTTIPTRVSKLWVSETGLNCFDAKKVLAYSRAKYNGKRKAESRTVILDDQLEKILAVMDVETTTVATQAEVEESTASSQLCYRFISEPDIDLLDKKQFNAICETTRSARIPPTEYFAKLEVAQRSLMEEALGAIDEHAIKTTKAHYQSYMNWMRERVTEIPLKSPPHLQVSEKYESPEQLYQSVESYNAQGKLFMTIGRALKDILEGTVDPLQVLFDSDLGSKYYEACNREVLCNEPLIQTLQLVSHKNPQLKILEIGAGTGAATTTVLEALTSENGESRFASYDYTDVSPVFFGAAENTFKAHSSKMNFRMLDIEYDPLTQGYDAGAYDIIVAGGVLHATKNLEMTLTYVRSLLKPSGRLILYEVVRNADRVQFAFGLLPGWWLSEEEDRVNGPCVGVERWDQLLRKTGFSGVDVDIPDFLNDSCHEFSIMLSTAVQPEEDASADNSDVILILGEDTVAHFGLAKELRGALEAHGTSRCAILSLEQAATYSALAQSFCIFLTDLDRSFLANLNPSTFHQLQQMITQTRKLLWVSASESKASNPESSMLEGFSRVLHSEFSALQLSILALDGAVKNNSSHVRAIMKIVKELLRLGNSDWEPEYVVQNDIIHTRRLVDDKSLTAHINVSHQPTQTQRQPFGSGLPLMMNIGTPGLLDTLEFIEDPDYQKPLGTNDIEIVVKATGINFRDCLTALGQIDGKVLGGECSGVVSRVGESAAVDFKPGDRVIACEVNTFRTLTRCIPDRVTKMPDQMSFAEAASIPITFITAYYSFYKIAQLQPGESVLIHLGAGGTGQAAIQIAKHIGATIYTTVGSEKKKQMLINEYGIPSDHIFFSRNTSFADAVKRKTHGRGVDVVLNSLAGDSMYASWDCVAPFGRFVEIGKRDVLERSKLPMFNFNQNISFSVVDLSIILLERPWLAKESLVQVLEMMTKGVLHVSKPLTVYGVGEVEGAFRSLQSGNSMGKMVVELRSDDVVKTNLHSKASCNFQENASYLIAGGLGGLGRSVARWMASRGARNLILLSRNGPKTPEAIQLISELHNKGVRVEAPACDILSTDSLLQTLEHCTQTMPPIRGCVQSSMVLKDAIFEKMGFDDWKTSVDPKVTGSWNLHCLLPSNLDFFLFLSSVSGITGLGGQTNYAAGNTYIDALAKHRLMHGQHATTLNLGWMVSEGIVAGNEFLEQRLRAIGYFIPISVEEFHSLLDVHCDVRRCSAMQLSDSQSIIGLETPLRMKLKSAAVPDWMARKTFAHMKDSHLTSSTSTSSSRPPFSTLLQASQSVSEAARIVAQGLVEKISNAVGIPEGEIDTSKPLYEYGVDSLLAIEVRNWAMKECGAEVAVFEIMDEASFLVVGERVAGKSRFCGELV